MEGKSRVAQQRTTLDTGRDDEDSQGVEDGCSNASFRYGCLTPCRQVCSQRLERDDSLIQDWFGGEMYRNDTPDSHWLSEDDMRTLVRCVVLEWFLWLLSSFLRRAAQQNTGRQRYYVSAENGPTMKRAIEDGRFPRGPAFEYVKRGGIAG